MNLKLEGEIDGERMKIADRELFCRFVGSMNRNRNLAAAVVVEVEVEVVVVVLLLTANRNISQSFEVFKVCCAPL